MVARVGKRKDSQMRRNQVNCERQTSGIAGGEASLKERGLDGQ